MEDVELFKCSGCLNTDRRLVQVADAIKLLWFSRILAEDEWSAVPDRKIRLCWECNGRMSSFLRFREYVRQCHRNFSMCGDKTIPKTSNLTTEQQLSLSYSLETDETENESDIFEIITPAHLKIKEEIVSAFLHNDDEDETKFEDFNDEDDMLLIELSGKKRVKERIGKRKEIVNGVRKKRRKKKLQDDAPKQEPEIYREIELDREAIEKERAERESQEEYVNAMFKCEKCLETFPNKEDMSDHERVKHLMNASKHVCDICTRSFSTEVSYNYHTNRHRRRFECMTCMARFISKGAVERHYLQLHGVGIHFNNTNGDILQNGDLEKAEVEDLPKPTSTTEFPCEFCDKVFKWKTSLRKHSETHRIECGQKRRPYCEPCRLSFTTTANLQKHVRTSSKHQIQLKLRKLKESGETVETEAVKTAVRAARATHTCPHCGAAFQWRGNLARHLDTHTARARGELVCKPCNRSFSSIATFTQHMTASRRHVTETEFKYMCSDCGKKFANKTRLQDHVDWEHLKRYRHKCSDCGKVFRSDTSLKLHAQSVHRNGPLTLCHRCGRGFATSGKLVAHIAAAHCAQAACSCAYCGKRFSWRSCLSRHVKRAHAGEAKTGEALHTVN